MTTERDSQQEWPRYVVVNLDKHECVAPAKLGCEPTLRGQLDCGDIGGVGGALVVLCACSDGRDLVPGDRAYQETVRRIVGRWAGDRIAIVSDSAQPSDLPSRDRAEWLYLLCMSAVAEAGRIAALEARAAEVEQSGSDETSESLRARAAYLRRLYPYRDISDDVLDVLAHELDLEVDAN